ncbi:hypothetical protein J2Z60_001273 [Lactobacillus colini]|uniref:Restriction endonuclease type IV Mrr domain-containing protein n=1 Tax=Lactobacillus colini TaxID=1819254 RepID=A0ABS4MFI1_9LACO|nr:restriction endonuclease [Lactobacillus colini]MBP2058096.1 hypothetical protein [Lactobacillus colini]
MDKDNLREKANKIADEMNSEGIPLPLLLQVAADKNLELIKLGNDAYKKFAKIYKKLVEKKYSKAQKGELLEELTSVIFEESYPFLFEVRRNQRTSSNEIDLQINWSDRALLAGLDPDKTTLGYSFLCECKNYDSPVGVTYVGKFFSLLSYTNTKLGLLIAWDGITGKNNWNDSEGLIRKLSLAEKVYIIPIEKDDLENIYNKSSNIFKIIKDKYLALKNDIDYKKFIKEKHQLEQAGLWE